MLSAAFFCAINENSPNITVFTAKYSVLTSHIYKLFIKSIFISDIQIYSPDKSFIFYILSWVICLTLIAYTGPVRSELVKND